MTAEKSKRHRKVAFVFFMPLTRKQSYEVAKKHEVRVFEYIYDIIIAITIDFEEIWKHEVRIMI